jgi:hypothetical protein
MTQMSPELVSDKPNDSTNKSSGSVRDVLKRGVGFYKLVALISTNTIITLIVANVLSDVANKIWEKQSQQQEDRLSEALFTEKYPDYTVPQFRELVKEKRRPRLYEFAPYLGYKFRPVNLEYTHVTPKGFRWLTDSGPWPPSVNNLNVFVYGASTTFGVGVTDDQTIPAQLQAFLKDKCDKPVKVYNFGTPSYNSTTERVQFANMLTQGLRPDVAVFVDGNLDAMTYSDDPPLTDEMKELMEDRGYGLRKAILPFFHELPMTKLGNKLRETLNKKTVHTKNVRFTQEQLDHIIARYTANKRLIEVEAREFGVHPLFVWQPCSRYHFDQKYNPLPEPDYSPVYMVPTYERMGQIQKDSSPEFKRDFLWLADIQEGMTEPCYLDSSQHYRANLCKKIGIAIGQSLLNRHLLVKDTTPPVESSTR